MNELDKALEVIAESGLSTEELAEKLDELRNQKKTNYNINEFHTYYYIDEYGDVCKNDEIWYELENFNAFPIDKRQLAAYIAKKQKLERALLIYSDLHGAEKMEYQYIDLSRWYIVAKLDCNGQYRIFAGEMYEWNILNLVYFNTKKDADRAIELYKDEIKEVLRLQRELYKDDSKTRR
jgi:hypothetical protein